MALGLDVKVPKAFVVLPAFIHAFVKAVLLKPCHMSIICRTKCLHKP